jgi:hypothetical protein
MPMSRNERIKWFNSLGLKKINTGEIILETFAAALEGNEALVYSLIEKMQQASPAILALGSSINQPTSSASVCPSPQLFFSPGLTTPPCGARTSRPVIFNPPNKDLEKQLKDSRQLTSSPP